MYVGYHEHSKLPFKVGDVVLLPKGTPVKSTNPARGSYVTNKEQRVRVAAVGSGQSFPVGTVTHCTGLPVNFRWSVSGNDLPHLASVLGLPYETPPEQSAAHREIERVARQNLKPVGNGIRFIAEVPTLNPTVRWAGTGGYWCEADINHVKAAQGL